MVNYRKILQLDVDKNVNVRDLLSSAHCSYHSYTSTIEAAKAKGITATGKQSSGALVLMGDGELNDNVTVTVWKLEGKAYHMADTEEDEVDPIEARPMVREQSMLLRANGDDQNKEAPDGMEEFSEDEYKIIRYIVHIKDDEDSKNLQVVSGIKNDGTFICLNEREKLKTSPFYDKILFALHRKRTLKPGGRALQTGRNPEMRRAF